MLVVFAVFNAANTREARLTPRTPLTRYPIYLCKSVSSRTV